jgi:ribosomal protein S18 acetylase RimI-like enzyme
MMTDIDVALVRRLEECSLNAWPGLTRVALDGWVATFGRGFTGRANSVYPLYTGYGDVDAKIARVEALYRAEGIAPSFKVTGACLPGDLDARLIARGYGIGHGADVLVCELAPAPDPPVMELGLDAWLRVYQAVNGATDDRVHLVGAIMAQVALPRALVAAFDGDEPMGCAFGVLDDAWVGLYALAVRPAFRRRGLGEALTEAVRQWGLAGGVRHGYLQVVCGNTAAQRLYARMGYVKAYDYCYRVKEKLDG